MLYMVSELDNYAHLHRPSSEWRKRTLNLLRLLLCQPLQIRQKFLWRSVGRASENNYQVTDCNSLRVPIIHSIFGVVGMLKLLAGSYLVIVTESERVGQFMGHPIFKITSLKVLLSKNSSEEQKKDGD